MRLGERIEKIFGIEQSPDWDALVAEPVALDMEAIEVGPGQKLHRFSVGHARGIEERIQALREIAAEEGNRPLTFDEHARVTAMEDVLLRGAYLLRGTEQVDAVCVDGVIATEEEVRAAMKHDSPVVPYETAALRGAVALGRILSAEEIAAWEHAETTRARAPRRTS